MGSEKTAISRNKPSVPIQWLYNNNLLKGKCLDYGCGQGYDALTFNMDKYDPWWWPFKPKELYDTITCIYVLNVVDKKERENIISRIKSLLKPKGKAYIAVRRDIKKKTKTPHGYQYNVKLNLPVVNFCKGKFEIYEVKKKSPALSHRVFIKLLSKQELI